MRQAKAVAALSCTIRGHHEAEEAFMTHAALDVFRRCLEVRMTQICIRKPAGGDVVLGQRVGGWVGGGLVVLRADLSDLSRCCCDDGRARMTCE